MATPWAQPYSQWHTENIYIQCTSTHFMQGVSWRVCIFSENYALFHVPHYTYIYTQTEGWGAILFFQYWSVVHIYLSKGKQSHRNCFCYADSNFSLSWHWIAGRIRCSCVRINATTRFRRQNFARENKNKLSSDKRR